jgi:hypothetical protein
LPAWFRDHIPERVALTGERENEEGTIDPGRRLAALGVERDEAIRALSHGAWWPLEKGNIKVRLGDGFSGVDLRLKVAVIGYEGQARTYQDVGDVSHAAHVRFDRVACTGEPKIIDRHP